MRTLIARGIPASLLVVCLSPAALSAELPRILWRFQLPEPYVPVDPVMAADGTLYVMDLLGELHADPPPEGGEWILAYRHWAGSAA